MAPRKRGLPKAVEAEDDERPQHDEPTLKEFIQGLHGDAAEPQNGMPTRAWLKEQFDTKSAAIRYLSSEVCPGGPFAVKDIAKHLDIKYQHVRNVATSTLKRGPNEDWRPKSKPPTTV